MVPWVLLVPPVAVGSAWLLQGERPSPGELVGGLLLVGGALVAQGVVRRWAAVVGRLSARLGVARAGAVEGGEGGDDPARGEVGGTLVDLLDGQELRVEDLPRLVDDAVHE